MAERTGVITFKGGPLTLIGPELKVGDTAPSFKILNNSLEEVTLDKFKGKTLIISVAPSLDTPVCSLQTQRFNKEIPSLPAGVEVITVSADLPFAQARFCGAAWQGQGLGEAVIEPWACCAPRAWLSAMLTEPTSKNCVWTLVRFSWWEKMVKSSTLNM